MIPGMNPKMLEKAMKKMGITQEEIEASEVVIKCADKDLVIKNPSVSKVHAMGQETFQIVGEVEEVDAGVRDIREEDITTVMEQTKASREMAKATLIKNKGDIAKTILDLRDS